MNNTNQSSKKKMNFQERIAWLGRMPLRYKVLFGTQFVIMSFAAKFRLVDIERARAKTLEMEREGVMNANRDR